MEVLKGGLALLAPVVVGLSLTAPLVVGLAAPELLEFGLALLAPFEHGLAVLAALKGGLALPAFTRRRSSYSIEVVTIAHVVELGEVPSIVSLIVLNVLGREHDMVR